MKKTNLKSIKKGLVFNEFQGDLRFNYKFTIDGTEYIMFRIIPKNIVERGKIAVLKYSIREVIKETENSRKAATLNEEVSKYSIPIQTEYNGVALEGRVVEASSIHIKVKLDKPLGGESRVNLGFAPDVV